jgi:PAS domain S-box-containing protein
LILVSPGTEMNWHYEYTPYIWPPFLTVLLLLALSAYAWRRRSVPGALPFMISCLFAALWAAGSIMEYAAVDVATKIFWVKAQAVCPLPATTATICFILEYTWPGRWLTRRNLALLSIAPLVFLGLALTNDLHHLVWLSFSFHGSITPLFGPGTWFFIAYVYGLGLIEFFVFVWLFRHSPQHRWPVVIMLIGQIGGRTEYLLEATNKIRTDLPIDIISIAVVFLTYAIALFGFRIFDPITLARQTVIAQMRDGMLVLDSQGRVASLNLAAEQILGVSARSARGRPVKELLPAYPDRHLEDAGMNVIEFSLGEVPTVRDFTLAISQMKDWRGLEVGRLLLLRDVTEPKRARELQKQQQLLLATLQERERLARELHDSLGQTLAAARLQASTARLLLAQGETAQTDKCLEQMADMTIEAETDVREYLLGAKTSFSADRPFFEALRQYAARFSQQYSLQVGLSIPPQLEAQGLEAMVEVQLLRIIQEALSNIRKHARAKNVQVVFTVSGPLVQIAIMDDGQGFDPAKVSSRQAEGFGLQAMRERAEALGGNLDVISQSGQGTRVVVQVPARINGEKGNVEAVK